MIFQAFVMWVLMQATTPPINGEGCSTVTTSGRPVINMCESGSWTLGVVYVAVNTTNMGSSTRCSCTVAGQTQDQDITTTFTLEYNRPDLQDCTQTVIKIENSQASLEVKCVAGKPSYIFPTTENIALTLSRPSPVFRASLCLSVIPNSHAANNTILTCEGQETTNSIQPATTAQTTIQTTEPNDVSSASLSSSSSIDPLIRTTSDATQTTTNEASVTSSDDVSRNDNVDTCRPQSESTPVGVIIVAVVGWTLALGLAAGHLVLFLRRKPKAPAGTEADNSAYTSLSDVTRVNPRADPSYAVVQSQRGTTSDTGRTEGARGVYETVEGDSSVLGGGLPGDVRQGSGTYYNA